MQFSHSGSWAWVSSSDGAGTWQGLSPQGLQSGDASPGPALSTVKAQKVRVKAGHMVPEARCAVGSVLRRG